MRSLNDIQLAIKTDIKRGLTEETCKLSKEKFGVNRLTPIPKKSLWSKYIEKFEDPMIRILLVAVVISITVAVFKEASHFYDSIGIIVAVLLATGVAFISELKSDKEFELLVEKRELIRATVMRDGKIHTVTAEDIVVGDIVHLDVGDEIPADGWVLKSDNMKIDQALMTGESLPVKKAGINPDSKGTENNFVYKGTAVIDGQGFFIVSDVGDSTELGNIAKSLSLEDVEHEEEDNETFIQKLKNNFGEFIKFCCFYDVYEKYFKPEEKEEEIEEEIEVGEEADNKKSRIVHKFVIDKKQTPLQVKLSHLADHISMFGYIFARLIMISLLIRGIYVNEITGLNLNTFNFLIQYLMIAVVIIVVAVPEGLPMSVTISLALAMRKMTRANSLVRQMIACETIGSATVICSDKTGTLTKNKMEVKWVAVGKELFKKDELDGIPDDESKYDLDKGLDSILFNSALNSTAFLEEKNGDHVTVGNATEGALLRWMLHTKANYMYIRDKFEPLYRLPFSHETKRMFTLLEIKNQKVLFLKGAPEVVVASSVNLGDAELKVVNSQLDEASLNAMRTLAFAHKIIDLKDNDYDSFFEKNPDVFESGFKFSGFVSIGDPVREEVPEAIRKCMVAGISVKMITGDNLKTAKAVGREINLISSDSDICMTSEEFNSKSDSDIKAVMKQLKILARAKPLDKLRLVKLLQEMKEVVAVTGDGTNDAPALKRADVGLSMGKTGTEVAQEASKIVLLDDSFATIVSAVLWGRSLFENIQRFLQFQLTINVSALIISFVMPLLGYQPPFSVIQLLWINIIMDTFASIALCSEPPREELLKHPPVPKDANMITRAMWFNIIVTALYFIIAQFGLMKFEFLGGNTPLEKSTIFFTTFVFFQVWNSLNCKAFIFGESAFKGLFKNYTFLLIMSLVVIMQVLMVYFGSDLFGVVKLGLDTWLKIIGFTFSVLILGEFLRFSGVAYTKK